MADVRGPNIAESFDGAARQHSQDTAAHQQRRADFVRAFGR